VFQPSEMRVGAEGVAEVVLVQQGAGTLVVIPSEP
jgi:hypothetical protein